MESKWPSALALFKKDKFNSDEINQTLNTGQFQKYPAYFVPLPGQSSDYGSKILGTMDTAIDLMLNSLTYAMKEQGAQINQINDQINSIESKSDLTSEDKNQILSLKKQQSEIREHNANTYRLFREFSTIKNSSQ